MSGFYHAHGMEIHIDSDRNLCADIEEYGYHSKQEMTETPYASRKLLPLLASGAFDIREIEARGDESHYKHYQSYDNEWHEQLPGLNGLHCHSGKDYGRDEEWSYRCAD